MIYVCITRLHLVFALMLICHGIDEPKKWRNAPISLQLVARPYEEEAVIRMAEIIDDAVKSQGK